jgi:hypothetical protein
LRFYRSFYSLAHWFNSKFFVLNSFFIWLHQCSKSFLESVNYCIMFLACTVPLIGTMDWACECWHHFYLDGKESVFLFPFLYNIFLMYGMIRA